ncbi:hypothetical protein F8M41_018653 [Gigaspora margarita]|uniref:Uncharacterized protein n=1 Tax=Gigaspora margarita TaxID=4874 RepID=A0A8H4ALE2_GIGMA|nr:hypothetical protein F8M41_018653 [Gigaspora margarita]
MKQEKGDKIMEITDQDKLERLKNDKSKPLLDGEALKDACEIWNKKVDEFRRLTSELKGPIVLKLAERKFHVEDYYWIGLKANKNTASDCHPKLYTPKPCSWNGASKKEIMAFDLDVNSIEDNRSETKNLKSLKENY